MVEAEVDEFAQPLCDLGCGPQIENQSINSSSSACAWGACSWPVSRWGPPKQRWTPASSTRATVGRSASASATSS
jgi:hypothetical protein